MDQTLSSFIRALRNADVRISTAETLDAFNAVQLVGYENRANLKRTLSLVLPKTVDEKETFDSCFDRFFSFESVRSMNAADSTRTRSAIRTTQVNPAKAAMPRVGRAIPPVSSRQLQKPIRPNGLAKVREPCWRTTHHWMKISA